MRGIMWGLTSTKPIKETKDHSVYYYIRHIQLLANFDFFMLRTPFPKGMCQLRKAGWPPYYPLPEIWDAQDTTIPSRILIG